MTRPALTPAQTAGPFLSLGLTWPDGPHVVDPAAPGAIRIGGRLFDGQGHSVGDGLIETWQADPNGRFPQPGEAAGAFRGFGRCLTVASGAWEIVTLKPAMLPAADGGIEAPHLDVSIFARGLLHRLVTRIYFADEEMANAADPVLAALDDAARNTLLARPADEGYRIDIYLQGPHETVFFAL